MSNAHRPHNGTTDSAPSSPLWHTLTSDEVTSRLEVESKVGLTQAEVHHRLNQFGPNRLYKEKHEPFWEPFVEAFTEPPILLLLLTGVLYAFWGELLDTVVIFAVILILIAVEVFNEQRAKRAIKALRQLAAPSATVLRDGEYREVAAEEIVPGDIILLEAGKQVAADGRLLEAYTLAADETALTGESVPVDKEEGPILPADTTLADRHNLVFAGTIITRGRGMAVVIATGMTTELGRIAALAGRVKPPRTPLQKTMRELSRALIWVALGFSLLVPLLGILGGQSPQQMLLTGLSLAFATIPEELPIIITMVLALGGYRLSQQQAIVKQLQAVETLGAITVIATDKTGTLTENKMAVSRIVPDSQTQDILEIGVLCNHAVESQGAFVGDPLETALLQAARQASMDINGLRQNSPILAEFTFDNTRKRMSIVYQRGDALEVAVKGAPEAVLDSCDHKLSNGNAVPLTEADQAMYVEEANKMAADGLRVLAFARKAAQKDHLSQADAESHLVFVGLIGLADPPRPEVKAAIQACRAAGIRTLMITGDHSLTARAIAQQVGLNGDGRVLTGAELDALTDDALGETVGNISLYARTMPEHKLRIVHALHRHGERVAVTGDGINDAPALAAADIGIAMGETGTDAARDAAAIVLADDNFATIVRAVAEGRTLSENLKKAVRYYLACKVALIGATLLPVLLRVPVPFAPIQIILMELFMDLAASATFVAEPAESGLMHRPPRDPRQPFLGRAMITSILSSGAGLFAAVSAAYLITWYSSADLATAQTVAFLTWLLGHVLLAFNLRSEHDPLVRLGFFSNRLMVGWGVATMLFLLIVAFVPGIQTVFKTTPLTGPQWLLVLIAALLGTFWLEVRKLLSHSS